MIGYAASSGKQGRGVLLFLFGLLLIAGCGLYTQLIAHAFGYSHTLGPSIFRHVYWPWQGFVWWDQAGSLYPDLFKRQATLSVSIGLLGFGLLLFCFMSFNSTTKGNRSVHGTASFASFKDVLATGLIKKSVSPASVVVGGFSHRGITHILYHDGPEHVLGFAPSRSGKGVCLMLPTVLTWTGSLIMLDVKGEGWALSSGWRKKHAGNHVLRFDPTDETGTGARFNPLSEIRATTDRDVADTQVIANLIVDPDGKGLTDHWQKTAFALITGVILHLIYKRLATGKTIPTLADVGNELSNPEPLFQEMKENTFYESEPGVKIAHPLAVSAALDMINRADRERSSVLSTAVSYLTLYRDPILAKNIKESDFRIDDLINADKPVSLYLILRPSDKERVMPLIRLMVTMITTKLTTRMEFENGQQVDTNRHKLLLMLDEFSSLRRLELLEQQLPFLAGYGIKCYFLIQDIKQLYRWYSDNESITPNCHIKIAFAANEIKTAQYISNQAGEATIIKVQTSASGHRMSAMLGNVSRHYSEVKRPLLTPDEVLRLPGPMKENDKIISPGEMLIFVSGSNPIKGVQPLYFQIPAFAARAKIPPPKESDKMPTTPP